MLRGVIRCIREHDLRVQANLVGWREDLSKEYLSAFDGMLVWGRNSGLERHALDFPVVRLGEPAEDDNKIDLQVPHERIGQMAAQALLDVGAVSFGYYDGTHDRDERNALRSKRRCEAFREEINATISPLIDARFEAHGQEGFQRLREWIRSLRKPIFAYNDLGALIVAEACQLEGIDVPREVSIVGVDNDRLLCMLYRPFLTSIDPMAESVAYEGMRLLIARLNKPDTRFEADFLPMPVVCRRESTEGNSCPHPAVQEALELIENSSVGELTPSLIAQKTDRSLRRLEVIFRENLDCTIQQSIIRERVRRTKRLLRESNDSFERIAGSLSQEVGNLRKQFRQFVGLTPRQYRDVFREKASIHTPNINRTSRSDQISICFLSALRCHSARGFLRGIEEFSRARPEIRLALNVGRSVKEPSIGIEYSELPHYTAYDGFILAPEVVIPEDVIGARPLVFCEHRRDLPMSFSVEIENTAVGESAAKHFLSKGHRTFAYFDYGPDPFNHLSSDTIDSRGDARFIGYKSALLKAGIDESNIHREAFKSAEYLHEWLLSLPKPSAVFVFNDTLAATLLTVCGDCGINVPRELSVVGVDNDELLSHLALPTLSSVDVSFQRMGFTVIKELVSIITGEKQIPNGPCLVLPRGVVERDSSRDLAISERGLNQAVAFMRQNYSSSISGDQIAEACGISRRALEYQFKSTLDTSPRAYLELLRINAAKELLCQTDLTVEEIAARVGFRRGSYLTQVFKNRAGELPLDYRRLRSDLQA